MFRIPFVLCALYATARTTAMLMPEDTEILAGYEMADDFGGGGADESPLYFELRSLTGDSRMPIRNRRSAPSGSSRPYQVLVSPGLRSHFVQLTPARRPSPVLRHADLLAAGTADIADYMQNIAYANLRPPKRSRRSVAAEPRSSTVESMDAATVVPMEHKQTDTLDVDVDVDGGAAEALPSPAKLTMSDDYPAADQNEAASGLIDSWHDGSYVYAKMRDDAAALAAPASEMAAPQLMTTNEGIKGRMPRVHFITQKQQQQQQPSETLVETKDALHVRLPAMDGGHGKSYRSGPQKRDGGDRYGGVGMRPSASSRYHSYYDVYDQPAFEG